MQLQLPLTLDTPDAEPLLTPEEFRVLVARLKRDTNRVRSVRREVFSIQSVFNCFFFLLILERNAVTFGTLAIVIALNAVVSIYINEWRLRRDKSTKDRLQRFLESTQDVSQLGTIVDLYDATERLGTGWDTVRTATDTLVLRLLMLLQPEHTDVLNTQQRAWLRRRMFRPGYFLLVGDWLHPVDGLAVLSVLEKIGDKRDLPDVERLLKDYHSTDEVHASAERCAHAIRERVAREDGKDFLLRADRKPEAVETLLRPSAENATTPPQQLLRAATSEYCESEGQT